MLITLPVLLVDPVPMCHSLGLVHFEGEGGGGLAYVSEGKGGGAGGCSSFREGAFWGGEDLI